MDLSDRELAEKAKLGDKYAFAELFYRYKDKILGYLYRYVNNYQTAEDLTIETFMNAYTNLAGYTEMGVFSSWLYRIATNCAKKELRRRSRHKEVSLEEPVIEGVKETALGDTLADEKTRPDYAARENELQKFIYRVVSKLKKKYKDALILCDSEGLGYEEAARVLHCNRKTVGTRLRRARKLFYGMLRKYGFKL